MNSLVHIPGFGDFQMNCIEYHKDPYSIEIVERKDHPKTMPEMDTATCMLQYADPNKQVFI